MDLEHIKKKFNEIGARIIIDQPKRFLERNSESSIILTVVKDKRGEIFILTIFGNNNNLEVLNINSKDHHLLLMNKTYENDRIGRKKFINIEKFLCGHDERHWFVAGVNRTAKDVITAKQSLKPKEVEESERLFGIKPYSKKAHKHRNKARIRQGEWSFIPVNRDFDPNNIMIKIHKNEPIRRGGSKPHMCEELVRIGGEVVMVRHDHPNGISMKSYENLMKTAEQYEKKGWRQMSRNMTVYVRGRITHPDHKTVVLKTWHIVVLSNERTSNSNAFLD